MEGRALFGWRDVCNGGGDEVGRFRSQRLLRIAYMCGYRHDRCIVVVVVVERDTHLAFFCAQTRGQFERG